MWPHQHHTKISLDPIQVMSHHSDISAVWTCAVLSMNNWKRWWSTFPAHSITECVHTVIITICDSVCVGSLIVYLSLRGGGKAVNQSSCLSHSVVNACDCHWYTFGLSLICVFVNLSLLLAQYSEIKVDTAFCVHYALLTGLQGISVKEEKLLTISNTPRLLCDACMTDAHLAERAVGEKQEQTYYTDTEPHHKLQSLDRKHDHPKTYWPIKEDQQTMQ